MYIIKLLIFIKNISFTNYSRLQSSLSSIQKVLVISSGMSIFTYTSKVDGLQVNDEQLLSGFLGAFQSFSSDMGAEINSVKFKQVTIFYRILKLANQNAEAASIVFIADEGVDEKDIRIRMEYACQVFMNKYYQYLTNNIVDSSLFNGFSEELNIIINADRNKIEDLLPKSFFQALIKELQISIPIKHLEKVLKKYDFVYDQQAKTLIIPGDIDKSDEKKIIDQLEKATTVLFGKGVWEKAFEKASKQVG